MGDAIGHMLTSAVGIAISLLPLIAVILMLATPEGRANGFAFTGGWVLALTAVVTAVILAGSGAGAAGADGPAPWTLWLKLALGLLFLLLGARQWKDRPGEGHEASTPGWMKAIDSFTPAKAHAASPPPWSWPPPRTSSSPSAAPSPSRVPPPRPEARPSPASSWSSSPPCAPSSPSATPSAV